MKYVYVVQTKLYGRAFGPFEDVEEALLWVHTHEVGSYLIIRLYEHSVLPATAEHADECGFVEHIERKK